MDVKQIDVGLIKAYAKNAKKHPEEQIKAIANSIKEFGFRQPLVLDKNMEIIVGHGRLAAAKLLGMTTVPVVMADDLTEEQVKAFRLADNKTNESDWDFGLLAEEISDLPGLDLTDFGFNEAEILELTINDSPVEIPNAVPAPAPVNEEQGCTIPQFAMPVYNPADYEAGTAEIPQYQYNPINQAGESELTKEDINYYAQRAEQRVTRRVIIVYSTDEEEAYLKQLLAQETEKPLGVVLDVKNVMRKREQGNAESEK